MSEIVSEPRPPNFFTEFDDNDDDDVLAIQVRRGGLLITDALIVDERVCFTASDLLECICSLLGIISVIQSRLRR